MISRFREWVPKMSQKGQEIGNPNKKDGKRYDNRKIMITIRITYFFGGEYCLDTHAISWI